MTFARNLEERVIVVENFEKYWLFWELVASLEIF